ncbi:MAG TPA: hypothetical protein VIL71_13480 [Spirillospora sp.]
MQVTLRLVAHAAHSCFGGPHFGGAAVAGDGFPCPETAETNKTRGETATTLEAWI